MQNLTTLGEVFDRVDKMSRNCVDRIVNVADLSFDDLETINIAGEKHPLRTIAQRSIAWRLGIPFNYLQKCPPELQAEQMHYWIKHEKNDQLFARFDGQDVRAIFTPKYKPVDNFEVIERLDSMGYSADTPVQCHLDDQFMSLSIIDGKRAFEVNGDRFRPGINTKNSEVGVASLSVAAFVLRLICTNGLVSRTEISASYRHVSTKILTELPQIFEKVSLELGNQRNRIRLSLASLVDDPLATIERFNKQFQLKEPEREAVAWAFPQESGYTMFHMVNTYTKASQMEGLTAECSYRLQKVGGEVLGMLS
jgi:hypothetical protein